MVKPLVDFPKWMGAKDIKANTAVLFSAIKTLFTYNKPSQKETFEAAMMRLKLTENDLARTSKQYKHMALINLSLAIITLLYAVFLLIERHYLGGMPALGITLLFLVLAFRNHFWFFQIRQRKLGCTVREWFNYIIGK